MILFQILNAWSMVDGLKVWFLKRGERIEGLCSAKFLLSWLHIFSEAETIGFALKEDKGRGSWEHMADRKERCEVSFSKCAQAGGGGNRKYRPNSITFSAH